MSGAAESTLDLILRTIGEEATLRLVSRHGGKIKRIPKQPTREWRKLLGKEAALALCRMFGDCRIQVPKAAAWRRAARDRLIVEHYERYLRGEPGGLSVPQLVEKFDLVETTVRAILKRPVPARPPVPAAALPRTLDLFAEES